jgi:hypothetical protein
MGEKTYKMEWLMPLGLGEQYGVKQADLPKGMESLGAQSDWLGSTEHGLAVWRALKGAGFEVADVGMSPVFTLHSENRGGRTTFWVPYVRWWQHIEPVGYKVHYIPVRVELAGALPAPSERLAALPPPPAASDREQEADGEDSQDAAAPAEAEQDAFRTFEVYGVRGGSVVNLMQVLEHHAGRWHVKPGCEVRATSQPSVGLGLAGTPGLWREHYPQRSPEDFGLETGKGVLYWEPKNGRALAASTALLTSLFGRNWRSTVYRTEEEHA